MTHWASDLNHYLPPRWSTYSLVVLALNSQLCLWVVFRNYCSSFIVHDYSNISVFCFLSPTAIHSQLWLICMGRDTFSTIHISRVCKPSVWSQIRSNDDQVRMTACTRLEQGNSFVVLFAFDSMFLLLLLRDCQHSEFFVARVFHPFLGCHHLHFSCVLHFIYHRNGLQKSHTILQTKDSRNFRFMVGLIYWEGHRNQTDQSTQSGLRCEGHVCHCWVSTYYLIRGV